MYLDAFTISALVDEFLDLLVGGRVQDSLAVDADGIGLEIYANHKRHYLYLSADSRTPRVHLVAEKLRRGLPKPTNVGLLFRRYVEGGVILHVSQPPWERVLQIDVVGPEGAVSIIVEPMERRSNLLVVQNGIILDCMRRVGPDENRYRVSLPAHEYVPPPPQVGKRDPFTLTLPDMIGLFEQNTDAKQKTQAVLTSRLLGVSPLLAKEILFRAGAAADQKAVDADPGRLLEGLQTIVKPLQRREWQPGIVQTEEGVKAFSIYPLESMPGWAAVGGVSEALAAYYGAPVGLEAYDEAKKPVLAGIQEARAKLSGKLASLQKSMTDDSERETLRQSGELILAYQYTLQPGQQTLKAQYDPDGLELAIELDTRLSPLENAQRYFERYNKAKRALDDVPDLIEDTQTELDFLAQLETDLELAANWPEIDEVQQALQVRGHWKGKTTKRIAGGGQSAPLRVVTKEGFVIWVGRNSRQNELVTFQKGSPVDVWLHVRGVPGAHVIIKTDGRRVPEAVVERAAGLAAYYSSRRSDGKVPVDVTLRKNVRKIKGGAQGMVTYRNEETRNAEPRAETEIEN